MYQLFEHEYYQKVLNTNIYRFRTSLENTARHSLSTDCKFDFEPNLVIHLNPVTNRSIQSRVNFKLGCQERRDMMTGSYIVRDAKCHLCDSYIGWKYVEAENYEEKYKEGNFVIELEALDKDHTRYMKKRINELFK
ncbi:hypothetical protein WICPIJ_007238 [Wickerhamomyces pijperi]|uniref:Protein yippee-like n=1 Tax=Wickerhamomyces pijperi TaxID=599730 RepID=A0A9P8TK63_WICPI|nr:hypothetical protein WICPIJ_007238 [Wickerhamomyces pijperi]